MESRISLSSKRVFESVIPTGRPLNPWAKIKCGKLSSWHKFYKLRNDQSNTCDPISAAYDFENDSKITPYIEGSYVIAWADDVDDSASGYGIAFGLSTPVSDEVELWGAVGLSFSSDQTENVEGISVNVDGGTEWGFSTGLRIRL